MMMAQPEQQQQRQQQQQHGGSNTQIIRPRAVKAVHNPIMTQQFQQECRELGVPSSAAAHAIQQSADWNRKWVSQDEEGHTMPHDVNQWEAMRMGAKNPSLSSSCLTDTEEETTISTTPDLPMLSEPMITQMPILRRPLALRPSDPAPQFYADRSSPQSPLTLPSDDESFESLVMPTCYSIPSMIHPPPPRSCIEAQKETLLHSLAISGGDVETKAFEDALVPLLAAYDETGWDARDPEGIYSQYANTRRVEGMWLTLSKPTYFGNLGQTPDGDPMYTLGRMAFDMFLPTQLVCSLQGNFNPVEIVSPEERAELLEQCPKSLMDEIGHGSSVLRKYNIVTAFTIEPHLCDFPKAPNRDVRRPIKGIMTTCGYVLPDPTVPNRLSIWFTGGKIEPNDDENDEREWKRLFNRDLPQRNLGEKVRLLAASLLMGAEAPTTMNDDGTMNFTFTRPLGGHGVAYVDVIYLDDTLRVVRGHRGTIFAFVRIPDNA